METATYRRNVMKGLGVKQMKAGLRYAARNTQRANILHAAIGIVSEVGELLQEQQNYLLVGTSSPEEKAKSVLELGDIAFYLVALAKATKTKVPGSGKKVKLVGTRGKALLDLQSIACDIIDVSKKAIVYGIELTPEGKLNVEAQKAVDAANVVKMKALTEKAVDLFFRLCFDMTGGSPSAVFDANIAKLKARYPSREFEADKPKAVA